MLYYRVLRGPRPGSLLPQCSSSNSPQGSLPRLPPLPHPSLSSSGHHCGALAIINTPSTVPTQRHRSLLSQNPHLGRSTDLGLTASQELQLGAAQQTA